MNMFLLFLLPLLYAEADIRGKIVIEKENYEDDGSRYQHTIDKTTALFAQIEGRFKTKDTLSKLGFAMRENRRDKSRDMLFLQDAYYSTFLDQESTWKILLGYKVFNWSVLEAFHPTSGLNSPNYGSSPQNWEKRGELVLELEKAFDFGILSAYFFPRFSEAIFPNSNSRRALVKNGSRVRIPSSAKIVNGDVIDGNKVSQFGARMTWSTTGLDASAYVLRHIDRRIPLFGTHKYRSFGPQRIAIPLDFRSFTFFPTPYYVMSWETGLSATAVVRDFIVKFEGVRVNYDRHQAILTGAGLRKKENYTDLAIGLEKSFSLLPGQDTTFFLEATSFMGVSKKERGLTSMFQRDAFFGLNHDFNDTMGKKLKLLYIADLDGRSEKLYSASYSQRINQKISLELGMRKYNAPYDEDSELPPSGLEIYDGNDSYFANLALHL